MRTYKIPALGLEIMANDIKTSHLLALDKFKPLGWRIPTKEEFQLLLDLSNTLGILGLTKGLGKHYRYLKKETGLLFLMKTVGHVDWNSSEKQLRLVRDI